jgi:hypothetical protein
VTARLNGEPLVHASGLRSGEGFTSFDVERGRLASGPNLLEIDTQAVPGGAARAPIAELVLVERPLP